MPPGKVLIRRAPEQSTIRGTGIQAVDSGSGQSFQYQPNYGEVIAVCNSIPFARDRVDEMKRRGYSKDEVSRVAMQSAQFLTDIEVKPGDKVVFRLVENWENEYNEGQNKIGLDIIISHDNLICRINDDGSVYPLAGNVLIENTRPNALTRVLATGKPVIRYFDFPGWTDEDDDLDGKYILANTKQSMPVQDPDVGSAIEHIDGVTDIAFIKRRYIHAVYEEPA